MREVVSSLLHSHLNGLWCAAFRRLSSLGKDGKKTASESYLVLVCSALANAGGCRSSRLALPPCRRGHNLLLSLSCTLSGHSHSRSPLHNDESPQAIGSGGGNGAPGDDAFSSGNTPAARGRAKLRRAARDVATQLRALVAARRALALEVCGLTASINKDLSNDARPCFDKVE